MIEWGKKHFPSQPHDSPVGLGINSSRTEEGCSLPGPTAQRRRDTYSISTLSIPKGYLGPSPAWPPRWIYTAHCPP
jgi:hypothetical protein